jgi:hypothetical protein
VKERETGGVRGERERERERGTERKRVSKALAKGERARSQVLDARYATDLQHAQTAVPDTNELRRGEAKDIVRIFAAELRGADAAAVAVL